MSVRSQELKDGKPVEAKPARQHGKGSAVAVAGLVIGCILWPIGARYSIDGLFWLVNAILAFLRIPLALATPPHWAFYCLLAPLPYLCSRVEWQPPLYRGAGRWHVASANVVVTWACVAGYDFGTTYLGIRAPEQSSAVGAEIAAALVVAATLGVILTFGPEWLIRSSWRQLRM